MVFGSPCSVMVALDEENTIFDVRFCVVQRSLISPLLLKFTHWVWTLFFIFKYFIVLRKWNNSIKWYSLHYFLHYMTNALTSWREKIWIHELPFASLWTTWKWKVNFQQTEFRIRRSSSYVSHDCESKTQWLIDSFSSKLNHNRIRREHTEKWQEEMKELKMLGSNNECSWPPIHHHWCSFGVFMSYNRNLKVTPY